MNKIQKDKIRIKDIAELAKVSVGTVDRVLHNRGEVSVVTRNQVLSIVNELGYTPNLLAKSLALKKTYKLAVLIPSSANDNPYWEIPLSGIKQANLEIADFNSQVQLYYFNLNDENSFIKSSNLLLKTDPDGVIFTPIFSSSSLVLINKCQERNLPYIFIDVNVEGYTNLAYFGQNSFQSGLLAARLMDYGIPDNSCVLILKMAHTLGITHHLLKREIGFRSFYENNQSKNKIRLISRDIDISETINIDNLINEIFEKNQNIKGVFVTNSRVHTIARFLEMKKIKDIILIGYDLTEKNKEYMESGTINFLIGQKPEEQGYKSVLALFNHLVFKRNTNKINYSPIDIIMKENIEYYKNYKF